MLKRILILLMLALFAVSGLTGCYATGKAAGEVAEEVDEGADTFEEGYEEGKAPDY